jgi:SH3-like domain-containing protein
MPLVVTAEYGHWRRVADRDGAGGWVHYSLLSGQRTVIVDTDMLSLRIRPDEKASIRAQVQAGVVGYLGKCTETWCQIEAGGYKGWAPKADMWGVDANEIRG